MLRPFVFDVVGGGNEDDHQGEREEGSNGND